MHEYIDLYHISVYANIIIGWTSLQNHGADVHSAYGKREFGEMLASTCIEIANKY